MERNTSRMQGRTRAASRRPAIVYWSHCRALRPLGWIALCAFAGCGGDEPAAAEQPGDAADLGTRTNPSSEPDGGSTSSVSASTAAKPGTAYTASMCPGQSPMPLSADRQMCDGEIRCGAESRCVPSALLTPSQMVGTPDCSIGKCLPDPLAAAAGRVVFRPCEGSLGAGVCVPQCFALSREPWSAILPVGEAGCGTDEVCAPCVNFLPQGPTGACDDRCAPGS